MYLLTILKTFVVLGNDRPQVLIQLEDCVLHAIISISKGKPRDSVMDGLHSQLSSLQNDLLNDSEALSWFNLVTACPASPSTPPPSEFPSNPLTGLMTAPSATPSTPRPSEFLSDALTGLLFQFVLILFLTSL